MLAAAIDFGEGPGTRTGVSRIRQTPLHAHPGVLEIVYLLRGSLRVHASFETFDLESGDFVVINQGDPHALHGSHDNATALVHIDLARYEDVDPYIHDIIFACESFDLARYRGQETVLRGMLLDLLARESRPPSDRCSTPDGDPEGRALIELLCTSYSMANYYQRERALSPGQRAKFHTIVQYLNNHVDQRDILGQLAAQQHYSKSWVSHLVKEVAGVSFTDLLTFVRVSRAERLLLDSNAKMVDISAACGFSDAKYFTRAFTDWFHLSPGEYRRRMQPEVLIATEVEPVDTAEAGRLVDAHRRQLEIKAEQPRLSITPLLLKNVGSRLDLFDSPPLRPAAERCGGRDGCSASAERPTHLMPIEVDPDRLNTVDLVRCLASFEQIDATPCLVLPFASRTTTRTALAALHSRLSAAGFSEIPVWLVYATMAEREAVDDVVTYATEELHLSIQPIAQSQPMPHPRSTTGAR